MPFQSISTRYSFSVFFDLTLSIIMDIIVGFIVFLYGLCLGSFLNVCIYRIPRGKSIILPSSFCPKCGKTIKVYDNIPIISFILLRGKCRNCSESISIQYPLVEFFTACFTVLLWSKYGLTLSFISYLFFISAIFIGGLIDLLTFFNPVKVPIPVSILLPSINIKLTHLEPASENQLNLGFDNVSTLQSNEESQLTNKKGDVGKEIIIPGIVVEDKDSLLDEEKDALNNEKIEIENKLPIANCQLPTAFVPLSNLEILPMRFEKGIIPDEITLLGIVVGVFSSLIGIINITLQESIIGIFVGGGSLFLVSYIYKLITKREGLGMGDVKLLAMIGSFIGFKLVIITLFLSSVIGSLFAIFLILVKKKERRSKVPFGPFISLSAMVSFIWGEKISLILLTINHRFVLQYFC